MSRSMRTRPLAAAALFFSTGIATGIHAGLEIHWLITAIVACISAAAFTTLLRRRLGASAAVAISFFLLGMAASDQVPSLRIERRTSGSKRHVKLVGSVESPVQRGGRSCRFLMKADAAPGLVAVYADSPCPYVSRGDLVVLDARLQRPGNRGWRNPGSPDWEEYWAMRGVSAEGFVPRDRAVLVLAKGSGILATMDRARADVERVFSSSGMSADKGVLLAMATGDRSGVPTSVKNAFRRSGTAHLLAISGLHVAGLAGVAYLLTWLLLARSQRLLIHGNAITSASLAALAVSWLYTALAGFTPSTLRASTIVSCFLAARILRRKADLLNSLGLAALIILALDPAALFGASFQLTFAAVLSIAAFVPRFQTLAEATELGRKLLKNKLTKKVFQGFLVTSAALAGTAPLTIHHFGQASLIGLAANLVAVPLASLVVVPSALASAGASLAWPDLGRALVSFASLPAHLLVETVRFFSELPGAYMQTSRPGWPFVAGSYLVLAGIAAWRKRAGKLAAITGMVLVGIEPLTSWISAPGSDRLSVTFLDVGDGDAVLVESGEGSIVLVDSGPARRDSSGETIPGIAPVLAGLGIDRIDAAFMTHGHGDHTGGMPEVLKDIGAGLLVHETRAGRMEEGKAVLDAARMLGIQDRTARTGDRYVFPGIHIDVLHPSPSDTDLDDNGHCLVLRLQRKDATVLLTGDIDREAEARILARGLDVNARLLKLAHHGSSTSSSKEFIEAVSPELAVVSAGRRKGHPSAPVVRRFESLGIPLFSTSDCGAVKVVFEGGKIEVHTVVKCEPRTEVQKSFPAQPWAW